MHMLVVGLTGGIASGKSTVAGILKDLGALVIDADTLSREVVLPHTRCWKSITAHFGKGILNKDLSLNRKKLAARIFSDPEKRMRLNRIIHPAIKKRIRQLITDIGHDDDGALVIVDAALLVETGMYRDYDRLVVVAADENVQLGRLMRRDRCSLTAAQRRLRSQLPLAPKMQVADHVINNQGSLAQTRRQTRMLFKLLCALPST
jgi:dephospho-CoA kinase